jgi:ubiquitin-like domain-containing CTD phosphatase 1
VADDFDSDFTAGSIEWIRSVENSANLSKFTHNTQLFLMNSFRTSPPKPLLVLDLDHTLLDFSSRALQDAEDDTAVASLHESICRPFMHEFLAAMYQQYDLAVWSQTAYVWVEHKLIELGIASNSEYKLVFALDKTSMFKVEATKSDGENHKHYVKPLGVIWDNAALPRGHFSPANTVHIDDLAKNFVLNPNNGVACTAYYRKKSDAKDDVELALLAKYLSRLANEVRDFQTVDHSKWRDVAEGKPFTEKR